MQIAAVESVRVDAGVRLDFHGDGPARFSFILASRPSDELAGAFQGSIR